MKDIAHLCWRAGFGLSLEEWEEKKTWSRQRVIDDLFARAKQQQKKLLTTNAQQGVLAREDMTKEEKVMRRKEERKRVASQGVDWIKRMGNPKESALLERMTFFWHGHFACKTKNSKLAIQQINAIRQHCIGNFRDLVLAIAKDVSMIRFLNNQQNKKQSPNENFARELMELFTLGRGQYSEQDIKEAARAFTGWSSNLQGAFVFRRFQHDFGQKSFMGKKGDFDGTDIIDIILEQKACALFISRKMYQYFVNEQVDEYRVQQLAEKFYNSNYNIEIILRNIFEADWFYQEENRGNRIKSPVDLIAGMLRSLQVQFENDSGILFIERALGQQLFDPPNVAGWPGGKAWIDNATLLLRLNLISYLFRASNINFKTKDSLKASQRGKAFGKLLARIDLESFENVWKGKSKSAALEYLKTYFLQQSTTLDIAFIEQVAKGSKTDNYLQVAIICLLSLPEYQMC